MAFHISSFPLVNELTFLVILARFSFMSAKTNAAAISAQNMRLLIFLPSSDVYGSPPYAIMCIIKKHPDSSSFASAVRHGSFVSLIVNLVNTRTLLITLHARTIP
ncbi:hypothetical protein RND81_14G191700 [Saponaria officinalis]|uniref:Secreted protein n=1 Tax=Saponaria officinalis TaxID=3572 RepID=A0AAW1GZK9_SAPOF